MNPPLLPYFEIIKWVLVWHSVFSAVVCRLNCIYGLYVGAVLCSVTFIETFLVITTPTQHTLHNTLIHTHTNWTWNFWLEPINLWILELCISIKMCLIIIMSIKSISLVFWNSWLLSWISYQLHFTSIIDWLTIFHYTQFIYI